jgi:hypothetical protein
VYSGRRVSKFQRTIKTTIFKKESRRITPEHRYSSTRLHEVMTQNTELSLSLIFIRAVYTVKTNHRTLWKLLPASGGGVRWP